MKNRDIPAQPMVNAHGFPGFADTSIHGKSPTVGLTKLEYAAIHAMQGMLAMGRDAQGCNKTLARGAVERAKALFDELEGKHDSNT